jgi:hypothetical protein
LRSLGEIAMAERDNFGIIGIEIVVVGQRISLAVSVFTYMYLSNDCRLSAGMNRFIPRETSQ